MGILFLAAMSSLGAAQQRRPACVCPSTSLTQPQSGRSLSAAVAPWVRAWRLATGLGYDAMPARTPPRCGADRQGGMQPRPHTRRARLLHAWYSTDQWSFTRSMMVPPASDVVTGTPRNQLLGRVGPAGAHCSLPVDGEHDCRCWEGGS